MSAPLLQIDLLSALSEMLQHIAILYTVITLFLQKFTAESLDRRAQATALNRRGLFLFALLAASSMLLRVEVLPTEGVWFDLRLSIITLAGIYLGVANSIVIALFTVAVRLLFSGAGALWWASGAVVYGPLAYLVARCLPGRAGITLAAVVNTALFMSLVVPISFFSDAFIPYSPYTTPANFIRLLVVELLMIPTATLIIDWALKHALAFHQSYWALEKKANIDEMTGLLNHRRFQELLADALKVSSPQPPTAIMMIDIDHFKQYNDTFGHQQGDEVLRKMAGVFVASVRRDDLVARYGGEEFIIILPNTSEQTAHVIAERIRTAVAGHPFPGREKMSQGQITVSIGIAEHPVDATDKNSLIAAADQALYAAKNAGRNRISLYKSLDRRAK